MLSINQLAPDFTAKTDAGKVLKLSDLRGKWIVLYFYPKDGTSYCTQEAKDFNHNYAVLTCLDSVVVGVSPDPVDSHSKFKAELTLNFTLVSDEDKKICRAYDVWKDESGCDIFPDGMVNRSTFIIDPKGEIVEFYSDVNVEGHVGTIIEKLQQLQKGI